MAETRAEICKKAGDIRGRHIHAQQEVIDCAREWYCEAKSRGTLPPSLLIQYRLCEAVERLIKLEEGA